MDNLGRKPKWTFSLNTCIYDISLVVTKVKMFKILPSVATETKGSCWNSVFFLTEIGRRLPQNHPAKVSSIEVKLFRRRIRLKKIVDGVRTSYSWQSQWLRLTIYSGRLIKDSYQEECLTKTMYLHTKHFLKPLFI